MFSFHPKTYLFAFCGILFLLPEGLAQDQKPKVPDLLAGGKKDQYPPFNLGPTGAFGWIWAWNIETTDARQILVTKVTPKSPSDGILKVDDVIIGVNGKAFTMDARKAFANAIVEAEKTENQGKLKLLISRAKKQQEVTIPLKVMGSYSATAPFDCPKSKLVMEESIAFLKKLELSADFNCVVDAIALLSTGDADGLKKVDKLIAEIAPENLKIKNEYHGLSCWHWSMKLVLLCEYYHLKKNEKLLPPMREYARMIALACSRKGTWGHNLPEPELKGRLEGYGAMNSVGIICFLSLIMLQDIEKLAPEVETVLTRSKEFFRFYVNKGTIPYGDHFPETRWHDESGRNGAAAIAFDILGDVPASRFFSRMSQASFGESEHGHHGNYFSFMWATIGASRGGMDAASAYFREHLWYYDMARRWDGGFHYQGEPAIADSFSGWDFTGVILLNYCLPKRIIQMHKTPRSKAKHPAGMVEETHKAGVGATYWSETGAYDRLGNKELLMYLRSWSPVVRHRAALALSGKKGKYGQELVDMLNSGTMNQILGACEALKYQGDKGANAVDSLIKLLSHEDIWVRVQAGHALMGVGEPAKKAIPNLLKLVADTSGKDGSLALRRYIASAVIGDGGLVTGSLDMVDRKLLYPALKSLFRIDNGEARGCIGAILPLLKPADIDVLWTEIFYSLENPTAGGEFEDVDFRVTCLKLLSEKKILEGVKATVDFLVTQENHASEVRTKIVMAYLLTYGAEAKQYVPKLKELAERWRKFPNGHPKKENQIRIKDLEAGIAAIEATTTKPKLRSVAGLIKK